MIFVMYGLDRILTELSRTNLTNIPPLFKCLNHQGIRKRSGEMDVLIGFLNMQVFTRLESRHQTTYCCYQIDLVYASVDAMLEESTKIVVQYVKILHLNNVRMDVFFKMNNKIAALTMRKSTEQYLSRNPKHSKTYKTQICDMMYREVMRINYLPVN